MSTKEPKPSVKYKAGRRKGEIPPEMFRQALKEQQEKEEREAIRGPNGEVVPILWPSSDV